MKKYLYLCLMSVMYSVCFAQINDGENWELVLDEEFMGNREWNLSTFKEQSSDPSFVQRWDCMTSEWWPYYVTTDERSHQAFQPSHARFGNDHKMRLVAECMSTHTPLVCANNDYLLPSGAYCSLNHNGHYYPPHPSIFYYSGTIETTLFDNWFGYYEIKCQLPVHPGEATAFWLYGHGSTTYEEIDIFEHSKDDSSATGDMATGFSCGIWYNTEGTNYLADSLNDGAQNYCKKYLAVSETNDLTNEHVFGLEWLPDRITWYFDGSVVNECTNRDQIPQHPLRLKVTHPVFDDALSDERPKVPVWTGSDEVVIDYIKYYQIRNDCDTDATIGSVSDFNNCTPGTKRTITIGSSSGIVLPASTNKHLRAQESITITGSGGFTIPIGAQVTLMTNDCVDYQEQ